MKQLRKALGRLRGKVEPPVYALYYRSGFGRRFPFADALATHVRMWEEGRCRGDIPLAQEGWELKYQTGRWAFLSHLDQLARYSLLVGYLHQLKPGGAVLDVGCGQGVLLQHYRPYGYSRYVGLDLSQTALANLVTSQNGQTTFLCVDAETYEPTEKFDAIVFNETLYYFHEPLLVMARYVQALRPNGIILVSTYGRSARALAILRVLKASYPLLDEAQATHAGTVWVCSAFRPEMVAQ